MLKFIVPTMHENITSNDMLVLCKFQHTTAHSSVQNIWPVITDLKQKCPPSVNLSPVCCDPAQSQTKHKWFILFCCL